MLPLNRGPEYTSEGRNYRVAVPRSVAAAEAAAASARARRGGAEGGMMGARPAFFHGASGVWARVPLRALRADATLAN